MSDGSSRRAAARRARRDRGAARRPGGARRPGAGPQARPPLRRARPGRRGRTAAWRGRADDAEAAARAGAEVDESFAAELPALRARPPTPRPSGCASCSCPRDPDDDRDVILEVKAGEGGEESALFAGDLLRMYLRYAERQGWTTEVLDATESDLGGYKDVAVAVKARGTAAPGDGVWARLKYEGGVHRVQRVPVTESQGRIHTSAAGVLVFPEAEDEAEVDDRRRTTCASTSTAPPARAASPSTPPTPPSASRTCRPASSCRCRTRSRSCRTGSRPCACCGPGCSPPAAGGGRGRGERGPPVPGPHGRPLRAHPHLQLPGEPHRRPPHRLQGVQPRRRPRRRAGARRAVRDRRRRGRAAGRGGRRQ